MPEILNRLRIIELDVLSRFDEAEHVGSVRLVKLQHGARGMPSFDPPAHGDEEEEAVRQMEAEALHALSSLTIDGSGVKGLNSDVSDRVEYRTARWTERPSGGSFSSEESCESASLSSFTVTKADLGCSRAERPTVARADPTKPDLWVAQ